MLGRREGKLQAFMLLPVIIFFSVNTLLFEQDHIVSSTVSVHGRRMLLTLRTCSPVQQHPSDKTNPSPSAFPSQLPAPPPVARHSSPFALLRSAGMSWGHCLRDVLMGTSACYHSRAWTVSTFRYSPWLLP